MLSATVSCSMLVIAVKQSARTDQFALPLAVRSRCFVLVLWYSIVAASMASPFSPSSDDTEEVLDAIGDFFASEVDSKC